MEPLARLRRDTTYALRQLLRAPTFTVAAVLTLAVGIGATAAVFSVVRAVVLRPLPFAEPERVVVLHPTHDGVSVNAASNLEYATWRERARDRHRAFASVAAVVSPTSFILARGAAESPEVVQGARATADYHRVLGVAPALGRSFTAADDAPGAPHVVVLSDALWRRAFAADPSVLNRQVRVDGESYTVIGVMPASLDATGAGAGAGVSDALWVPLALTSTDLTDFRRRYATVVARLAPDATLAQASAAIAADERRLAAQFPMWGSGYAAEVHRFADDVVGDLRGRLLVLLGAVGFVLLIACVNVANLLLARGTARARELAVRTALGARRGRLTLQLMTESAVLCVLGGALGVAIAAALARALVTLGPPGVPRLGQARVDGVVVAFTLGVVAACALVVGAWPAARAGGVSLDGQLRQGGRAASESRERQRVRGALVAAEVALAMALLAGAGLLIRTARAIGRVDPGFSADHVLTAQVLLPASRYPDLASGAVAYRAVRERVERTSGVRAAALVSTVPLGGALRSGVGAEGRPMTDGERLLADLRLVTPGYFATMRIALRTGRDVATSDDGRAPLVAVVNEALAAKLFPELRDVRDVIGKRIEGMDPSHRHLMEIVGVIAGPRDVSLDQPPAPEFYIPFEQAPPGLWVALQGSLTAVVRTAPAPATMERAVRAAVASVDPSLPTTNVATMESLMRTSLATARFNTLLLSSLGAIALVLAGVGVYGLIAYAVSARTREIAVRMALGAAPASIARQVLGRALAPVVVGAMAGAVLASGTTRLLRGQLYGVAPGDPVTLLAIALVLLVVSTVAAWLPVRRATRIPPASALV